MRFNINKFQQGGNLFLVLPTLASATTTPATAATTLKSNDKLISDSIMKELTTKGLTNDVNRFMSVLASVENDSLFSPITQSLIYGIYAEANRVILHAKNLEAALKKAELKNSFGDIAIDSRGRIVTVDANGKFSTKSILDYDSKKDMALTIGDLIELRKFNSSFTFNSDAASIISSAEGIERINTYIKNILTTVGTTSDTTEAYHQLGTIVLRELVKRPSEEQLQGALEMTSLLNSLGADALFKEKTKTSSKNMQAACKYIFSMLPSTMQQLLRALYVVKGGDIKDSDTAITDMIITAATMTNDVDNQYHLQYELAINKSAGTAAGKTGTEKQTKLSPLELLIAGTLNRKEVRIRTSSNNTNTLVLQGSEMPNLTDTKGKAIGAAPLSNIMATLGTMVDQEHMQIGDQKIHPGLLPKIVYAGGQVANVWAPVNAEGNVDLDLLRKLQEIQLRAKEQDILTVQDLNSLLQEAGIGGYFDEGKNYVGDGISTAKFLVFTGYTSGKVVDPSENLYSYELSKDESKGMKEYLNQIYGHYNRGQKKNGRIEFPFLFWGTDYIAAPVFMRIDDGARNYAGAYAGHGPTVVRPTYQQQIATEQRQTPRFQTMPSSNILMME